MDLYVSFCLFVAFRRFSDIYQVCTNTSTRSEQKTTVTVPLNVNHEHLVLFLDHPL